MFGIFAYAPAMRRTSGSRAGMIGICCALATVLTGANAAFGNDSQAGLGTGGLVLLQNDAIAMASEDLYISPKEVRITYRFLNTTDTDQSILVAFPLPDLDLPALQEGDSGIRDYDNPNFVNFSTKIDGRTVALKVQHRAIVAGVDITDLLARMEIPFVPPGDRLSKRLRALDPQERSELADYGAVRFTDQTAPIANWTLKTTFYWRQTFPANSTVKVEHRYQPVAGGFFISPDHLRPRKWGDLGDEDARAHGEGVAQWPYNKYCMDKGFRRAALKRAGNASGGGIVAIGREVDYILTTGNNWAGPIREFRLVVDKLKTRNLVSLCAKGIRKIAPTRFEWTRKDFYPSRDLKILFLEFNAN